MIIIRRRQLILLAVVVGATFLAFGWYGYHLASRLTNGGEETELLGENLLFVGIVASIVTAFLVIMMLLLSTNLERRLDRLVDGGRGRDIVPGRDFVGMGPLGDKLTALFNLLSRLNDQKTRKISSMQGLVSFLIRKLDAPVFITDVYGIIHYVSDDFLKRSLKRMDVINTNVTDHVEGLDVNHLSFQLLKTRKPVNDIAGKIEYSCYPIMDNADELAYMVFLIGAKSGYQEYDLEQPLSRNNSENPVGSGLKKIRSGLGQTRAGHK